MLDSRHERLEGCLGSRVDPVPRPIFSCSVTTLTILVDGYHQAMCTVVLEVDKPLRCLVGTFSSIELETPHEFHG